MPPSNNRFLKPAKPQFDAVCAQLLPTLVNSLPKYLIYHTADHVKGVIRDTDYLIGKESVPEEDRWMILTAALFHDAGFLRVYNDHEAESCLMARQMLPAFRFSAECIEAICRMIMATQIPQNPADLYGQILCDADLFYMGTDAFFKTAGKLYMELKGLGLVQSEEEWNEKQLRFLQTHRYFTKTAREELEPRKKQLITWLVENNAEEE